MRSYRFEIQSIIHVIVEAENEEEARLDIVDNMDRYTDEMIRDPYVSDGVEMK